MRNPTKRSLTVFFSVFAVLLCCLGMLMPANAADATGSLTLTCRKDDDVIAGMRWQLYRVGSRNGDDFVFDREFASYPVSLGDWSASDFAEAAYTLESYAIIDKIPPVASGKTDLSGVVHFATLETGLYMASGAMMTVGDKTYYPAPILFEVTAKDNVLNGYPKYITRTLPDGGDRYAMKKVWANFEDDSTHPSEVEIELYKNGEFVRMVTLSAANNWTFRWDVDELADWRVLESVVPGQCAVSYRSSENQFVIINTYDTTIDRDTGTRTTPTETTTTTTNTTLTTDTSTTEGTATMSIPSNPNTNPTLTTTFFTVTTTTMKTTTTTTNGGTTTTVVSTPNLPQTGQLWWPVPCFALCGIALIGIGARLNKSEEE